MLGNSVPPCGSWREVSKRVAGPRLTDRSSSTCASIRSVRMAGMAAAFMVTTRHPLAHARWSAGGTVAPELDRENGVAPSIALGQGERGHMAEGPCDGGPIGQPHTLDNEGMAT
jgi:hypothetical protein